MNLDAMNFTEITYALFLWRVTGNLTLQAIIIHCGAAKRRAIRRHIINGEC